MSQVTAMMPDVMNIRLINLLRLLVLLAVAGTALGCTIPRSTVGLDRVMRKEIRKTDKKDARYRCTVGAHRGDSVIHEENTIEAIRAACESKEYAFIEFDVQYTKDRQVIVFHDKRLLRMYWRLKKVKNSTYAQLTKMTDGKIALYSDVMDAIKRKKINIEIKSRGDLDEDKDLVDFVIADVKARKKQNKVMMSCISGDVVKYIKDKYPETKTGQIFWKKSSTYVHIDMFTESLYKKIAKTKADYLMLHVANLRNIQDLLKFKPEDKTIAFWDFDNAMYVVHKDYSDRMWGDSGLKNCYQQSRYKVLYPVYRFFGMFKKKKEPQRISSSAISM